MDDILPPLKATNMIKKGSYGYILKDVRKADNS